MSVTSDLMDYGQPNIRVFTDKNGLPQNAITSLVFDRDGYLWAGTKDGVARYDGRSWTVVNLPKELKTNWIHSLMAASDGSLWVGTHEGLAQLDRGQWRCFTKTDGLPDNEIRCVKEISNGQGGWDLWVGTWRGLARWTGQRWQTEMPFPTHSGPEISSLLERKAPDGHQEIWVGCPNSGIARWRDGVWTVYDQHHGFPYQGVISHKRQDKGRSPAGTAFNSRGASAPGPGQVETKALQGRHKKQADRSNFPYPGAYAPDP